MNALARQLAPWRARWMALAPRERRLVLLGAAAVALYVVVAFAIQPAWRRLRDAPAQRDLLDRDWQAMQRLAAEVRELRATPALQLAQAAAALKSASDRLGANARLSVQGERAVLTLTNAGTEQLRGWLAEARAGARARPVEATLTRSAAGYSGTIVVAIGAAAP